MRPLIWKDDYALGLVEIDKQHQKLFDIVNTLIDNLNAHVGPEEIADILTRLIEYSEYHFKMEETYMKAMRYPGLELHRQEHNAFIRKTVDFSVETTVHNASLPEDMMEYLCEWLVEHVMFTDKKIVQPDLAR